MYKRQAARLNEYGDAIEKGEEEKLRGLLRQGRILKEEVMKNEGN